VETIDRQLRYFCRIAELGSVSKAADVLDQTQSGMSKQLALLESFLGQSLFIRTGRGLDLTEAGAILYERTRAAFKEVDLAVADARQQGVTQGTVRLATVHTLSYYFTAEVVASFVSANPSANLSLMGRSSPEVVALVESGKADIGFVYDSAVDTGDLNALHLFEDEMALIVQTDSELQGDQDLTCQALRLVGFPSHYALRRMIHRGGLSPTFVAEAETIDAMLKLVSSGVGHCILPSRIPHKLLHDNDLRMLRITKPLLRRKVVLITNRSKAGNSLIAELQGCAERVAARLSGIAAMT